MGLLLSEDEGNVGLFLGDDGLMMIDGGYANRAAELQKAAADVDSHPVRILFNTHWHGDHEGLPTQTFTDGGKMTFGNEKIEYKWVPNSHTDNDAYLFLPSANVLHAGDLFFNGMYPVVDYTTGGWIGGKAAALDKLLKVGDAKTQIIPGHGPQATKDDMQAARDMLHTVHDRLEQSSKKGASLDDFLKANPVSDLESKWGQGFLNGERFPRMAYPSIARHAQYLQTAGSRHVGW